MEKVKEVVFWLYSLFGLYWASVGLCLLAFFMLTKGVALILSLTIAVSILVGHFDGKFNVKKMFERFKAHLVGWWNMRPTLRKRR